MKKSDLSRGKIQIPKKTGRKWGIGERENGLGALSFLTTVMFIDSIVC